MSKNYQYWQEWTRCGLQKCGCQRGEKVHGPYWYAYYYDRTAGKQRKKYVGKTFRRLPGDPLPQTDSRTHVHPYSPFARRKFANPDRTGKVVRPRDHAPADLVLDEAQRVTLAATELKTSAIGLVFVPSLAKALGANPRRPRTIVDAHTAILKAAHAGKLELRPESGLARLSDEELKLCPDGPQGTKLSWARVLS